MRPWWVALPALLVVAGASVECLAAPTEVTLAAPDALTWTTQAALGTVDDELPLVANAGDAKTVVTVTVSNASLGGESDPGLTLRLVAAPVDAGATVVDAFKKGTQSASVEIDPGQRLGLRIVGLGFTVPGTYRASVSLGGRTYAVRITASAPWPQLGLRFTEWSETLHALPWTQKITAYQCIPVDAKLDDNPVHVVVSTPGQPAPGSQRIPPGTLSAKHDASCKDDHAFLLSIGPMEPGRYDEMLDVQGEKLRVQLSFRAPAAVIILGLLIGAVGSMLLRSLAESQKKAAQFEYEMLEVKRGQRKFALVLDARRVANALQLARGNDRIFMRDDVERHLQEAAKVDDSFGALGPLVDQIDSALLPAPLRRQIQREVAHVKRLSSVADKATVVSTLDRLRSEAATGFRERVATWFLKQREIVAGRAMDVEGATLMLDEPRRSLVIPVARTALATLANLVEDTQIAWANAQGGGPALDLDQLDLMDRVEGALTKLWEADTEEAFRGAAIGAMFLDLPRAQSPFADSLWVPKFEVVIQRDIADDDAPPCALEEVTFGLSGLRAETIVQLRIEWSVRDDEWFEGGPRLTHVFDREARSKTVRARVRTMNPGQSLTRDEQGRAPWEGGVAAATPYSGLVSSANRKLRRLRVISWGTNLTVLSVGVVVVGIFGILLIGDKPFGTTSDYVGLLLAGVGIDTSTSSTMLKGLFDRITRGKKTEAPA
jgi:hypothetical protein